MSFPGTFAPTLFTPAGFNNTLSTSFNGVDEYVQTAVDFSGDTQFTISGWFFRSTASQRIDIAQTDDGNSDRVKLILDSSGPATIVFGAASRSSSSLGTGWFHLVYTYNGSLSASARIKLYVDGVLAGNTTGTPATSVPTIGNSQTLRIGNDNGSSTFANGNIDEVTVWGVDLSLAEVVALYNSGTPNDPRIHSQSTNLVNYWRMGDGDNATTIIDRVGSDNGTLVNMDASNYDTEIPT